MSPRHRLCLSVSLTLLACKFDATGLGETTGGPATGESSGTTGTTSMTSTTSGDSSSTTGTTSGDASSSSPESGGSMSASGSEGTTDAPASCGDGELDRGEACDDGNQHDDDACIACQKASCGDGFVQKNVESCDDGGESAACNLDCSLAKCGDDKFNAAAGEVCDLGAQNGVYNSKCSADCKGEGPRCGDGTLDLPDEKCEPSKPPPESTCAADCQSLICAPGRGNCDEDFGNGCEVDLDGDEDNCGECGKQCNVFDCNDGDCKP